MAARIAGTCGGVYGENYLRMYKYGIVIDYFWAGPELEIVEKKGVSLWINKEDLP